MVCGIGSSPPEYADRSKRRRSECRDTASTRESGLHGFHLLKCDESAANAGLIAYDDEFPLLGRKRGDGFLGPRKEAHESGIAEIAAFLNHSAVAIGEQAPRHVNAQPISRCGQ